MWVLCYTEYECKHRLLLRTFRLNSTFAAGTGTGDGDGNTEDEGEGVRVCACDASGDGAGDNDGEGEGDSGAVMGAPIRPQMKPGLA